MSDMHPTSILFTTRSYGYLQQSILQTADDGLETALISGKTESKTFPDGEHYHRINTNVEGRNVVLVGGTVTDEDTLEIYDTAGALVELGARSLTLVIPYFGYSTMERATKPGEVVTAKSRARLLSSIPTARFGNRVVLFDLHTEGLPYYFEGGMRTLHMYGKEFVTKVVRRMTDTDSNYVLACTDAGRAKWVESLANDLHVPASFVFKRRTGGDSTEVLAVSAQVADKHVIIYDDMIRTGGSLLGAAQAYKEAGAKIISVVTTHGVFPGDAIQKLHKSRLINQIYCTDSHPGARAAHSVPNGFLVVVPTGPMIARFLHEHPVR
jgi:ribose-phosphate pyrophosphokinase